VSPNFEASLLNLLTRYVSAYERRVAVDESMLALNRKRVEDLNNAENRNVAANEKSAQAIGAMSGGIKAEVVHRNSGSTSDHP
jgi:hypothetical protein